MTQTLYQKVMKFAGEKHKDQKVPGTEANYLLYCSNMDCTDLLWGKIIQDRRVRSRHSQSYGEIER